MSFWKGKKVIVTGGGGFLGSHVVEKLRDEGCMNIFAPRSKEYNLVNEEDVIRLFEDVNPDIIIHAAARVGGIWANVRHPGEFFYENIMMNTLVMEYARQYHVEKFTAIGAGCAYPKSAEMPLKEETFFDGYPEETNAPYGFAKRMMAIQSKAYREQYGFNSIYLIPVNLYGPRDNFDLENSHVIPALVRKFVEAEKENKPKVTVWGTGEVTREFLYVDDAAEGIVLATERYDRSEPINLGSGEEIKIKEIVSLIKELSGFEGDIEWDTTKPDGVKRRLLDVSKAKSEFGFEAKTKLEYGLKKTIDWYQNHLEDWHRL